MTKQQFAAFDIDGTLFRSGLYREVAYELTKMGKLPEETARALTDKHREYRQRRHGNAFEEFQKVLVTEFDQLTTSILITDYEEAVQRVLEKKAENVYVYTRNLIQELKSKGYFLVAISGSQIELVEPFARKYGFDAWVGQEWERGEEFFTGNIIKTHTGKDKIIKKLIVQHNLTFKDSYAVGDSNGDTGMLSIVDHPIAFNPTHELLEKATDAGWDIVVERKNVMYHLKKEADGPYVLAETRAH